MKIKLLLLPVIAALMTTACSNNVTVDSDYDTDNNFANYKTYKWHEPNEHNVATSAYLGTEIVDKRIRTAIENELKEKGFTKQESGDVDFLVNYTVATEDRTDVKTYNNYAGVAPGYYGGYYGAGPYRHSGVGIGFSTGSSSSNTTVKHWQQGTLVLDIIDPEKDQLVWRGTAEGRIPENTTQQEKEDLTDEVISRVLRSFPPEQ